MFNPILSFFHFRRDNKRDRHLVDYEMQNGTTLEKAIEKVLTTLNQKYQWGLFPSTITAVANQLARLEEITDAGNIVDIFTYFVHRYIIFENRTRRMPQITVDNARLIYAANHLDLVERSPGYFLMRMETGADYQTKYPDGY
jgi:hypothetical protein